MLIMKKRVTEDFLQCEKHHILIWKSSSEVDIKFCNLLQDFEHTVWW